MAQTAKNSPVIQETWVWFLGWEDPLEKGMATHSSHGQRSLAGYSPWGCKELDTTEWHTHTHTHTQNNLSWLGSWLSHHAPSTQSQTGNCLLTINTQWPFSFQAACLFDSSFLHLGDCSMVKWEARKWDELDGGTRVKNPPANTGDERVVGSIPGLERIPWSKKWQTMPVFLPRKFHRQRSLASYSSWGHRESCLTEPEHTCR